MLAKKLLIVISFIGALLCFFLGCDTYEETENTGTLTINLTDLPGDYEEVYITFTEVSIHRGGEDDNETILARVKFSNGDDNETDTDNGTDIDDDVDKDEDKDDSDNSTDKDDDDTEVDDDSDDVDKDDDDSDADDDSDDVDKDDDDSDADDDSDDTDNDTDTDNGTGHGSGWIVISSEEQGFDLLELQEGNFDLLAESDIETGKYTQIRLKITDGNDDTGEPKTYVKVNGVKYPLIVPSGTKSGLKLTHPFTITTDNETVLFLDFDADKSVKQTGDGKYQLKPTIKVLTELP